MSDRFDRDRLKILYCIPTLLQGGAERQLSYLATSLAGVGHDVHVASVRGGPNLDTLKASGVVWHEVGGFSNHDPFILLKLIRLIRTLKPDVIQTSLAQMDILGGIAAFTTRTRWIIREASSAPLYRKGWKNRLRFRLGRNADAVVSNSVGGMTYWKSARIADSCHVIHNAISVDEIARVRADEAPAIALRHGEKIVLFAGRMDSGKNVESLIVAASRIAKAMSFVMILCGDGPSRGRLQSLAEELGIAGRIMFPGYVANLWGLMKRADVFVYLSKFEGCPNVVLEAMACGCPLVVSDIPAHREILDNRTAYFVNPQDTNAAADAIKAALETNRLADGRTDAAKAQVAAWTIEKMASRYEQLYLSLLQKHDILVPDTKDDRLG